MSSTNPEDAMNKVNEIPILLRRRIEDMMLKQVLDAITERSGKDEAEEVIGKACSRSAIEQGKQMAEVLDNTGTSTPVPALGSPPYNKPSI